MWKINILKILCYINLFIPGSLGKRSNFLFLNGWALLSFIVFVIVLHHGYDELSYISFMPSMMKKKAVPDESDTSESVVHFSHVFPHLLSCALNMSLRIMSWILFPALVKSYDTLIGLKVSCAYSVYTWNEFCFLFLSIISALLRQWEYWLRNPPSTYFEQFLGHLECLIGESFPLKLAGVAMVCFVTLVSRNLEAVANSLENIQYPIAWTVQASNYEAKAREYLGFVVPPNTVKTYYKRLPSINRMYDVRKSYFQWLDLWKEVQGITGTVTFLLFLEMTISISFQSFLAVTSFVDAESMNSGTKSGFDYWLTVHAVIYTVCSIGIALCIGNAAYYLLKSGEKLHLRLLQLTWSFQKLAADCSQEDLIRERYISLLLQTVSHEQIRLTALGFFTVSRSTLTSIAGVIVTYLVVLIQFRTSSSSC